MLAGRLHGHRGTRHAPETGSVSLRPTRRRGERRHVPGESLRHVYAAKTVVLFPLSLRSRHRELDP